MNKVTVTRAYGQLYVVKTRGILKACGSKEKSAYIVAAASSEEVEMKLRHFVDLSAYKEFSVKGIERVKPNFHVLSTHIEQEVEQESNVTTSSDSPTLQPKSRNLYAFGLIGHAIADSEKSLLKRLSVFLARKAGGSNSALPFVANGHFVIEELGEADSTRIANLERYDPEIYMQRAKIVSGGAASPR